MPQAKGLKQADFATAMERLLSRKVIECDADLWRGPDRKPRRGTRLVGCPDYCRPVRALLVGGNPFM
jgi:hypothetical protein